MKIKFPLTEKLANNFSDYINGLTEEQLEDIIKECDSFTETNCWYLKYDLKDVIKDYAMNKQQLDLVVEISKQ